MAWKCKKCGAEIVLKEDNIYEDIFIIKKDGSKANHIPKKSKVSLQTYGWYYICEFCGNRTNEYYDDIESIGKWEE